MRRKVLFTIIFIIFTLLMSACGNGKKDSLISGNNGGEVEKVYNFISIDAGNGYVDILLLDREINFSKTYEDAIIMINEVEVHSKGSDMHYTNDDLKLEVGDEVVIEIYHSLLGTIEETLIVPDCPTSISTDYSVDDFLAENVNNITLNWDKIDCDRYNIESFLNGKRELFLGFVYENYVTLYNKDLYIEENDGEMEKANSMTIQLYGENTIFYETTFGTVDLRVYSPTYTAISAGE